MNKNDMFRTVIVDMSENGEGIGHFEGNTLFIKDTIVGDEVEGKVIKVKKNYGYGKALNILTPSPERVTPPCPVAAPCGGCQLQAMSYEGQLRFKENKVRNHLERIGHFTNLPMEPILGMDGEPFRYRNKAQFPFGRDKEGRIIAGFYAGRTHSIIPTEDCLLGHPVNSDILRRIIAHMEKHHIEPYSEETGKGLVRHALIRVGFHTGQIMVCLVINGRKLPAAEDLVRSLLEIPGMTSISLNVNRERTNVILGHEILNLYGEGYITDTIGDITFRISALSFYQVNPQQTEKLYATALEYAGLTGNETVWDLYCGIGTISLFLAQQARQVYGVEIVPAAIDNARDNAALNGITNAEFYVGKAEEVVPELYRTKGIHADVIVVDPPRKGCDAALLDTMLKMAPDRIVYVSCDSATLARDLRILVDGGYEIQRVRPCDMFSQGVHVESCVLLARSNDSADRG